MIKFIAHCFKLSLIIILLSGCKKDVDLKKLDEDKAKAYLSVLIDTMQTHFVYRKSIEWVSFRQNVLALVDKDRGYDGNIQVGIHKALSLLADNHSSFNYPNGSEVWGDITISCSDSTPVIVPYDSTIGYINVGTMLSPHPNDWDSYYTMMQEQIKQQDNLHIKGWIVDLRRNRGGQFYPMFRGVAPILGEGFVMYWFREDTIYASSIVDSYLLSISYQLLRPDPKVAVLTDRATASSGEAVTISFKGRPNTRSFGNGTCGVSTERAAYMISGLGILNLAVGIMADRNKTLYGGRVMPDEIDPSPSSAMQKAIDWLKQ